MKQRLMALILSALVALMPLVALAEPAGEASLAPAPTPEAQAQASAAEDADGETGGDVIGVAYAKKDAYVFKAKKVNKKTATRILKHEPVGVIERLKKWTKVDYLGTIGYMQNSALINELPTPTPTPAPTPVPRHPLISLPASVGDTAYTGQTLDVYVTLSHVITAFVLDYYQLGDGYLSRIDSAVSGNLGDILAGNIPSSLTEYEGVVSAVASDISGMVLELKGQALGAKKVKASRIFTQTGDVLAVGAQSTTEAGIEIFEFGTFTVASSVSKGTYYLQMAVSNAKNTRALYPEAESLTLLVPVKVAKLSNGGGGGGGGGSKQQPVARLILEGVRTEPANPQAGEVFDVVLTMRNTSETLSLSNLQLTYTADDDALRPVSGTNIEYIERIEAGRNYEQRLSVNAKPDLEVSPVKLTVSVDFEDKKLNALSAELSALIDVTPVQRIELDEPTLPTESAIAGESYDIEMGLFNLGKTMLYNVTVRAVPADPEAVSPGSSSYLGNVDPATNKNAELSIVPLIEGAHVIDLEVTYETVDGKQSTAKKTITVNASAMESFDEFDVGGYPGYEEEYEEEPPTVMEVLAMLPWQIYVVAGALLALFILMIGMSVRKRRLRMMEDDEMD